MHLKKFWVSSFFAGFGMILLLIMGNNADKFRLLIHNNWSLFFRFFYSTSQTQKLMQANQGAVHPEYRVIKCACRWLTKIFLSWLSYLINPTGLDHNVSKIPSVTWCGSSNFIYDQLTWENKQLTILTAFLTLTADLNDWSAENIIKQLCTLFSVTCLYLVLIWCFLHACRLFWYIYRVSISAHIMTL